MVEGTPAPWHAGSAGSSSVLRHGRLYYRTCNDLKRCVEQHGILAAEKMRLLKWLELILPRVRGAKAALLQERCCMGAGVPFATESVLGKAPWELKAEHGKVFWLEWNEQRLMNMQREADALACS